MSAAKHQRSLLTALAAELQTIINTSLESNSETYLTTRIPGASTRPVTWRRKAVIVVGAVLKATTYSARYEEISPATQ